MQRGTEWLSDTEWNTTKIRVLDVFHLARAYTRSSAIPIRTVAEWEVRIDIQLIRLYVKKGVEEGYLESVMEEEERGVCYFLTEKGRDTNFYWYI